jgi:alginate O-acetyltransferase complex protein AlgJ
MKTLRICFIILFLALLALPAIVQISGWKDKTASFENKAEVKKPILKWRELNPFPAQFEAYYNSRFPARNSLLFLYNYFSARYLQKSPKPGQVTIGKDGWLFLANYEQQVYTGQLRFSEDELKKSMEEIQYRRKESASLGADYRIVIIPSKFTVYPEFVPASLIKYPGPNACDQLISYLHRYSDIPVLDLRPAIIKAKKNGPLYMKGDNHWNSRGAYYGYREVINWLRKDYSIPPPLEPDDLTFYDTLSTGNIIAMLGMDKYWHNTFVKAIPRKPWPQHKASLHPYPIPSDFAYVREYEDHRVTSDSTLPSVLIIRDSFTNAIFRDLLSCHFRSSVYIWDKWEHRLNENIIRTEKPRIVLCLVIESMVDCFNNYPDKPAPKNDSDTSAIVKP